MVALSTPKVSHGWKAVNFNLRGVDENIYTLEDVKGANGLVVAFICNHCPYVKSIISKIQRDAEELQKQGIGFVGINPNDEQISPGDSFDKMKVFANQHKLTFPYVIDVSQEIAKQYDAVCTPDFFGFNENLELQYRGRLDSAKMEQIPDAKRELFIAMSEIVNTGKFSGEQIPSIGCSIKWR